MIDISKAREISYENETASVEEARKMLFDFFDKDIIDCAETGSYFTQNVYYLDPYCEQELDYVLSVYFENGYKVSREKGDDGLCCDKEQAYAIKIDWSEDNDN